MYVFCILYNVCVLCVFVYTEYILQYIHCHFVTSSTMYNSAATAVAAVWVFEGESYVLYYIIYLLNDVFIS